MRTPKMHWLFKHALLCLALVMATSSVATAQSDSELRRQNEQLASQVQELANQLQQSRDENEKLRQRIEQLEKQIAASRRSGGGRSPTPAPEPEKVTIDETVPSASPRALFKAIQDSYVEVSKDVDMGRPGDGVRRAYLKRLDGWKAAVDRQFRGPITWHARVVDARSENVDPDRPRERIVTLVAVDPQTDVRLGEPFDVQLSKTLTDRLANYEHRSPDGDIGVLVLRGTLAPSIRINEDRAERGSFDNPPFIGPFAEFLYEVDVKSLMPAAEDKEREAAATQPTPPERRGNKPPRPTP